jgi:hypothetical protein
LVQTLIARKKNTKEENSGKDLKEALRNFSSCAGTEKAAHKGRLNR